MIRISQPTPCEQRSPSIVYFSGLQHPKELVFKLLLRGLVLELEMGDNSASQRVRKFCHSYTLGSGCVVATVSNPSANPSEAIQIGRRPVRCGLPVIRPEPRIWKVSCSHCLVRILQGEGRCVLGFRAIGSRNKTGPLEDPVIPAIAARIGKTPAQVLLAWAERGAALLTTPRTAARVRENLNISALPEEALDEINRIQTRQRFNEVVKTGSPGFIPRVRS